MATNDSNPKPRTDQVPTPADDAVQGYGFFMDVIANAELPSILPHAATPVPYATGGAVVGTQGGATTTHRMS